MKIGFGNEEKKLRWGLSTRVVNQLEQNICVVKIGFGSEVKKLRWGLSTRASAHIGGGRAAPLQDFRIADFEDF